MHHEETVGDVDCADCVLCDRHGRSLAVIEAKKAAINPGEAAAQGKTYAEKLGVPRRDPDGPRPHSSPLGRVGDLASAST